MSPIQLRILTLAAAITASSSFTVVHAQSCVGLAMPKANYLGAESRDAWVAPGRDQQAYGGRYAHRFDAGSVGIIASIGGGRAAIQPDSASIYLSGTVAVSGRITSLNPRLSVCAQSGVELTGVEDGAQTNSGDGLFSIPLRVGASYDLEAGPVHITPYVSRTIARYAYEVELVDGGQRQWGWNGYNTYGITSTLNRFAIGAGYRDRDSRFGKRTAATPLGNRGSFIFSTGVAF